MLGCFTAASSSALGDLGHGSMCGPDLAGSDAGEPTRVYAVDL